MMQAKTQNSIPKYIIKSLARHLPGFLYLKF